MGFIIIITVARESAPLPVTKSMGTEESNIEPSSLRTMIKKHGDTFAARIEQSPPSHRIGTTQSSTHNQTPQQHVHTHAPTSPKFERRSMARPRCRLRKKKLFTDLSNLKADVEGTLYTHLQSRHHHTLATRRPIRR